MKRLSIVSAVVLGALAAPIAHAHVNESETTLGIASTPSRAVEPGSRVIVHGRLRAQRTVCEAGELVRLFEKRPGSDRLLGSDRTDGDGEYRIVLRPTAGLVVYSRFSGSSVRSYGHSHACRSDNSPQVRINVRRR